MNKSNKIVHIERRNSSFLQNNLKIFNKYFGRNKKQSFTFYRKQTFETHGEGQIDPDYSFLRLTTIELHISKTITDQQQK